MKVKMKIAHTLDSCMATSNFTFRRIPCLEIKIPCKTDDMLTKSYKMEERARYHQQQTDHNAHPVTVLKCGVGIYRSNNTVHNLHV